MSSTEPAAAVAALPWRAVVEMTGRDRVRFLHGMCTHDIKKLGPGQGCLAAVVNRQGKMVGVIHVLALEASLRLFTDRDNVPALLESLGRFIIADDVAFRLLEGPVFAVFGPGARAALGVPDLPDGHGVERDGRTIVRDARLAEDAYEVLGPMEATLTEAAYEARRIAAGVPRWGVDMGPDLLPMEAGLEPVAISYSKGCYIGQEVIQRVKTYSEPPRRLVSLDFEGAASPGDALKAGAEEAGRVTSAAGALGLGIVRKEHAAPGSVVDTPGGRATLRPPAWHARLT